MTPRRRKVDELIASVRSSRRACRTLRGRVESGALSRDRVHEDLARCTDDRVRTSCSSASTRQGQEASKEVADKAKAVLDRNVKLVGLYGRWKKEIAEPLKLPLYDAKNGDEKDDAEGQRLHRARALTTRTSSNRTGGPWTSAARHTTWTASALPRVARSALEPVVQGAEAVFRRRPRGSSCTSTTWDVTRRSRDRLSHAACQPASRSARIRLPGFVGYRARGLGAAGGPPPSRPCWPTCSWARVGPRQKWRRGL